MRALVLGAGVSGRAAARLLRRHGTEVVIFDERSDALLSLRDEAFEMHGGEWSSGYLKDIDMVVTSPGFSDRSTPIVDSLGAGLGVWSELELGWRHTEAAVVAVTGTNGKTTTTQLISAMAVASDIDAVAAGNIGDAMCDVAEEGHQVIVAEASSFQLRFIDSFAPSAACVLNVAPDHLDWHGSFEAYVAAKGRIADNMGSDDPVVYDADDPGASSLVETLGVRRLGVSGSRRADAGGYESGSLYVGGESIDIGATDGAFALDMAAAAVAAATLGASLDGIAKAVAAFEPAPHRRRVVAARDDVQWVDDSKATNPHAAAASAAAYESVILIAGGRSKGLDLSVLATVPTVRRIIAIGEAAQELLDAAAVPAVAAGSLEEAVGIADEAARAGDTVLLAPGCASFDQFESYAARGEAFATAVEARSG